MKQKIVHNLILILIIVNVVLAFYSYLSSVNGAIFCVAGGDCGAVQNSEYGKMFGMKVSLLGTGAFILLLIAYSFALRHRDFYIFFVLATLLGTIFSIYFIYLQIAIIKQICSSCIAVDIIIIAIFFLSLHEFVNYKKDFKSIKSYFR